ncbi:MAG: 1-hydroxy-2-methyl-2-(E)-butenyl 4-diphosphate reductase, 4Fe-4S protein [Pseudomonadota bacterium]|jgi:4-hydroxy-3-methylbut-2-enyl diphosphate reductase
MKKIILANPRGFCAGVDRAIDIVEKALIKFGSPIYVRHEVVHNKLVVQNLQSKGVIFINELDEVPNDGVVIFSAHGVSNQVENAAKTRKLRYFDATCPLVSKVHHQVERYSKLGKKVLLIGHKGHPEVEGTMGRHNPNFGSEIYLIQDQDEARELNIPRNSEIGLVTQTTLSLDDTREIIEILKQKFPKLEMPRNDDICYATQNRQDAVKQLALEVDFVIVIGSKNSSNSNRLKELAERCGTPAILVDEFKDIDLKKLEVFNSIGLTAGASAPEATVQEIAKNLAELFNFDIKNLGQNKENIFFKLPPELR